jgi:ribosomal protein S18 acetylase RimI-like enzyme
MFGSDLVDDSVALIVRPAGPTDEPFLRHLFKTTRAEQFRAAGLPPAALDLLLEQQYRSQASAYAEQFGDAASLLIQQESVPIGRALLNCDDERWHIIDIALLPSQRGQGIGSWVIERIAADAEKRGARSLTLAVLATNQSARRLYARLGFADIDVGTGGTHVVMSRHLVGGRHHTG